MAPSNVGLAEVQECLVKGGYFRARIQALPPFDVVAGGLAWCIQYSRFTIDVEFVENAEIRDKIRASENICAALHQRMYCPHPLEPHQIQGLDYPKIFIVLQWLMKRVAATREENAFFVDQFTMQDFRRRFRCHIPGRRTIKRVKPIPAPPRVLISAKEDDYVSPVEHASAVLLEYGVHALVKDSVLMLKSNAAELEGDAEAQLEHQKIEEEEKREAAMLDSLKTQMVQHTEKQKMSASSVNSVLATADTNKIAKLRTLYEQRAAALQDRLQEEENEKNELENQKERIGEIRSYLEDMETQAGEAEGENEAYRAECEAKKQAASSAEEELAQEENAVEELERVIRGDPAKAAQFDRLIELHNEVRTEESNAKGQKASSKKQIASLKAECESMAAKLDTLTSSTHQEAQQAEMSKYETLKSSLQEKLREVTLESMNILRKIDRYPTRLELKQYETRMEELNEEVAWKFEETKLMFAMHNTRTEVAKTLAGEQKVFDTVSEAFLNCIAAGPKKSASQRSNLLEQLESVVKQLDDTQGKQRGKLGTEQEQLAHLRSNYAELIAVQKKYFTAVSLFKEKAAVLSEVTGEERQALYGSSGARDGEEEQEDDGFDDI